MITDLKEPLSLFQKLRTFDKEEIHVYVIYKLSEVEDVIDFFNKAMMLSEKFNTTLLLYADDLKKEPVKQIYIKYKNLLKIEEITDGFFKRQRCSLGECS